MSAFCEYDRSPQSIMRSRSVSQEQAAPKPGELWQLARRIKCPLDFNIQEQSNLYSQDARNFIEGKSPPRYVMIVTEPNLERECQEVSVMVLSGETNFISNVDLLIPFSVSGIGQDLLAETWHVLPMLSCNLFQPVGRRLSRSIYDVLLNVGDRYHGLVDKAPSKKEIQELSLDIKQQPPISKFHRQEEAWSDVLSVPIAVGRRYMKGINLIDAILDETFNLHKTF
jgi:hypothetical protein